MLQAEWKRIINEIEKAIKKAITSNEKNYERSIKENNALIAVPLNSLADQLERYKIQQHAHDKRRARREIATIIGLFFTAAFTFITAIIFYYQLNEMRNATRHADEAARTQHSDTLTALQKAEDANANARGTAIKQLRAYLGVTSRDMPNLTVGQKQVAGIFVTNHGQTPANKVRYWGDVRIREYPLVGSLPSLGLRSDFLPVNPGQKIPIAFETIGQLSEQERAGIISGTSRIYLYGEIEYFDVFGDRRTTMFRFSYGGERLIGINSFAVDQEGNDEN